MMHQKIDPEDQGVSIPLLREGVKLIVVADPSIYEITIVRPFERLVFLWGQTVWFTEKRGRFAHYIESRRVSDTLALPDWIIKGEKMVLRLENGNEFISEPVNSVLIEGDGWKYEAIR